MSSYLYLSCILMCELQKINEPVKVVVEYEQGKAIPSQQILAKMERVLGVKLVCCAIYFSLHLI